MGKKFKKNIEKYGIYKIYYKLKKIFLKLLESLLEIVYPKENYCIICKEEGADRICSSCLKSIKVIPKSDSHILSYGFYGGALKQLILKFKYNNDFSAGDILVELLTKYIKENIEYNNYVLSYIPLSKKSKKKRGFNQCEYLARKISYILGIQKINILVKIKETQEQKTLKKYEREDNIKGAFKIKKGIDITNLNIILIDDVVTTGSTMKEAENILKKNCRKSIKLLTLAQSTI